MYFFYYSLTGRQPQTPDEVLEAWESSLRQGYSFNEQSARELLSFK
ncbi:hypothetical protein [Fodinibius salsisoli]|uniref:Uncharacterized protein n=1 Tax=Fodinibius salsisoli TaxID=2820877 RepID=A0ABT3PR40_9BACT|nr:hypothetical protein [Fodinibius salsisoli]MCW9708316.1 hypothetical protein [Fodinibius salsisoli]